MKRGFFTFLPMMLTTGYIFLYTPIVILVFYSFNMSDRVTVWQGFSLQWYVELWHNRQILEATWVSLKVALITASVSVFLGVMAAYALDRFRRFRGRLLFSGLVSAPLVIPEVILGLSLLLLFVSTKNVLGWPDQRGIMTIVIAHVTLCVAYVTIIVQARLSIIDRSIEEAALDLGAYPWTVFWRITLPQTIPALLAGFMIAFILSFDDLIIASFVSGPGASTLPMVVFSKVRLGLSPEINALATLLLCASFIIITISWLLLYRQLRQKKDVGNND